MDGLSKTLGVGPTIELGGDSYSVSAKILRHRGLIEAEIVKDRGNPFDMIRAASESFNATPEVLVNLLPALMMEAKNWNAVTLTEVAEFLENTWKGRAFTVWLSIRDNDPDKLTSKHVEELFLDDYEKESRAGNGEEWWSSITNAIQSAEGSDESGNLTGSPTGEEASQATEESPGT